MPTHEMRCLNDLCPGLRLPAGEDVPLALYGLLRFVDETPGTAAGSWGPDSLYRRARHAAELLLNDEIQDSWRVHYLADYVPAEGPSYGCGGQPAELDDPGCPDCQEPGVDLGAGPDAVQAHPGVGPDGADGPAVHWPRVA